MSATSGWTAAVGLQVDVEPEVGEPLEELGHGRDGMAAGDPREADLGPR